MAHDYDHTMEYARAVGKLGDAYESLMKAQELLGQAGAESLFSEAFKVCDVVGEFTKKIMAEGRTDA